MNDFDKISLWDMVLTMCNNNDFKVIMNYKDSSFKIRRTLPEYCHDNSIFECATIQELYCYLLGWIESRKYTQLERKK